MTKTTDTDRFQREQTLRVGAAIRALRGKRSVQWLADATAELGEEVRRSTITDIEIGRRRYVAVHELSVIAAALGVSPAVLLTHGSMPEGSVEFLPGREAPAVEVADWWGGAPLRPHRPFSRGLPPVDASVAALFAAAKERERLREAQIDHAGDRGFVARLQSRITDLEEEIRALGGMLDGDDDDGDAR